MGRTYDLTTSAGMDAAADVIAARVNGLLRRRVDRKSREWQDALWAKWPTAAAWPGMMDLYEAAAYLRVGYVTLWRACQKDRNGKAALPHKKIGDVYRVAKAALDRFGAVEGRAA